MIPGLYFEEILIHKLLDRPSDFRAVFRASPDAMLLVGADGLLRDANPEAETMFGWSREEMVGESVEMLVPPELRDRHRRHRGAYHRKPASRPMGVGMELEAVHREGGAFPVEISLGPMTDETGEVLVVCAVRSLAQSQMLRRVAAARVLAAEAERSRIARDLHDEVKQSLTAVQLHLAALVQRGMVGEDAPEMISGVQGNVDRCHDALDRAIRDLMPVELEGHGLEFALSVLCRRTEEQGFAVERDIRWAGRALRAETSLAVFRVVQEALNNAKRHSGAGSAKVRYWREGRTLYAEVSDSGAGFSPDELEPHLSVGLGSIAGAEPDRRRAAHRCKRAWGRHVGQARSAHCYAWARGGRPGMSYSCRVVLVDDHAVVRAGIKLLIELTERYDVVGEASSGEAAIERVDALKPDLVVMDIRMPGMDGIAATRKITTRNPDIRVLVLTAYDDPEYVEAAIEAGAMGCLSKRRARSDLVGALDMVAAGRMTFPAHVVGLLSKARNTSRSLAGGWDSLSDRERDVLYLTATGYTAEEIARRIHLAPKTVANYRMSVKSKLGVQSRVDLMRVVVESGHLADMLKTAGIGPKNP